ncbi:hypothetical protein ACMAZF_01325 [Psychrobium sp. nBUS_13]|uniref:hypothetical protein n=1 Tax=Psychrobium sp. nBUS_13 TaxID=3395319 RepID=UPI003EBE8060
MPIIRIDAGKEKLIKTSGKYLSIINSTGSFSIESPQFGSVLGELGRQLELDDVREVLFCNTSNQPLNVEYEVANIKVHISGKGGAVSIENLPAVQAVSFESNSFPSAFTVNNLPAVQQVALEANQSVSVDNLPAVQQVALEANQSVSVENLPAVQQVALEANQSVSVDNLPAVQQVALEANQSVSVDNLPAVQQVTLEPEQSISVANFPTEFGVKSGGSYNPLAPADFTQSNTVELAKNKERLTLVIMASEDNTGLIWVGGERAGIPLSAGREFNLGSGSAVTLYAQNPADTCYLAEVTK